MKQFFFLTYLSLLLIFRLQGEIIETKEFKEINRYVQPGTLVILDIDDTLLIPVQTLGTDVWFISRLEYHQKTEPNYPLALDRALAEWEAVRHLTNVKLVEEDTSEVIHKMQESGVTVMGLTTQGLALATRTVMQLQSLSINLSKTCPSSSEHYFINGREGVLYRKGILFTSGTAKGEALLTLLEKMNYFPERIIFINDKITHLQDVEKSVVSRNINFIGLRYSYSDERVANFSKEIAEIQWRHSTFNHLISDEEASLLLNIHH